MATFNWKIIISVIRVTEVRYLDRLKICSKVFLGVGSRGNMSCQTEQRERGFIFVAWGRRHTKTVKSGALEGNHLLLTVANGKVEKQLSTLKGKSAENRVLREVKVKWFRCLYGSADDGFHCMHTQSKVLHEHTVTPKSLFLTFRHCVA